MKPKPENLALNVLAEFVLDNEGKPSFIVSNGLKHFKIKLHTNPVDTGKVDTVVYKLHPTYYDPERVVPAGSEAQCQFAEEITSYGDFKIRVNASGSAGEVLTSKTLSEALVEKYKGQGNPAILAAIEQIRHL
jgi:hypothetical protein